jgi:predicted SPOUT superfamily RNA methylase MTH1
MQSVLSKRLFWAGALVLVFLLGILLTRWYYHRNQLIKSENSTVLLERIRQAAKLVTVEGYFSEIYDYKDYYGYDLSFFRKKALMRVKAKVSVGYDLEKMKITADQATKTIRITGVPPAEIISIEHDLDYYDVQEGIFNSFSPEDYNKLNANAKNFIREQALKSDLTQQAARQRNFIFETMRFMAESTGWKLETEGIQNPSLPD